MKCPHCTQNVSNFSKAMNKFARVKHCPFCHGPVRLTVNWLPFLLIAVLNIPVAMFLQSRALDMGLAGFASFIIAYLPMGVAWMFFGFRLVKVDV